MIEILYEDLEQFFRKEDEREMVDDFRTNTMRGVKMFNDIVGKLLPERNTPVAAEDVAIQSCRN